MLSNLIQQRSRQGDPRTPLPHSPGAACFLVDYRTADERLRSQEPRGFLKHEGPAGLREGRSCAAARVREDGRPSRGSDRSTVVQATSKDFHPPRPDAGRHAQPLPPRSECHATARTWGRSSDYGLHCLAAQRTARRDVGVEEWCQCAQNTVELHSTGQPGRLSPHGIGVIPRRCALRSANEALGLQNRGPAGSARGSAAPASRPAIRWQAGSIHQAEGLTPPS